MYNIDIVIEALSLYGQNKSFKKTSEILQDNIKKNNKTNHYELG